MRSATVRAEMRWYMDTHHTTPEATVALWAKRVPPEDLPALRRIMRRILATWGDDAPVAGGGPARSRRRPQAKGPHRCEPRRDTTPKRTESSLPIVPGEAP